MAQIFYIEQGLKVRALFIQHAPDVGGSAKSLRSLMEDGIEAGWDIHIVVSTSILLDYYSDILPKKNIYLIRNIPTFDHHSAHTFQRSPRGALRILSRLLKLIPIAIKINDLISKINPDVIHLNSSVLTPYLPTLKKRGARIGIHIRERVAGGITNWLFTKLIKHNADFVIYISPVEMALLPCPSVRSAVVYNYVRDNEIPARKIKQENARKTLVSLGGCSLIKGYEELMELARALPEEIDIRLVGPNLLRGKDQSIPKNVTIVGSTNKPLDEISCADYLIFWTNQPHFPRPVYEAWLVGVPCIVSNVMLSQPDITEATAIVAAGNDSSALIMTVRRAISGLIDTTQMQINANGIARRNFTSANFKEIQAIFQG